jgi:hypothetical protein
MFFRGMSRRISVAGAVLACCLVAVANADAEDAVSEQPIQAVRPALSLEQLACMNWCDLEQLYRPAEAGAIPTGYLRGRAIYCPGDLLSPARSKMTQSLWHGKHFCPSDGTLINEWKLGVHVIRAKVCRGTGWLDGKPSIIMDYRGMSRVWYNVRDEMREVAPGLYLGAMYQCKSGCPKMKMFFALEVTPCCH